MSSHTLLRSSCGPRACTAAHRRPVAFLSHGRAPQQMQVSRKSSTFLPTLPNIQSRSLAPNGRKLSLRIQNVRINNVEIPNNKRIEFSLQYIYGIGPVIAKKIVADADIENKRTYELNEDELTKVREEVSKYQTEADLRRSIAQNIKRLKDIGCYRGRRHIMMLPVRGQRTKTNARSRKGKPKTVAGKKKK